MSTEYDLFDVAMRRCLESLKTMVVLTNFSDDESNVYNDRRTNSASLLLSTLVSAFVLFKNLLNEESKKKFKQFSGNKHN